MLSAGNAFRCAAVDGAAGPQGSWTPSPTLLEQMEVVEVLQKLDRILNEPGDVGPGAAQTEVADMEQQSASVRVTIGIDEDLRMILEMDPSIVDQEPPPRESRSAYPEDSFRVTPADTGCPPCFKTSSAALRTDVKLLLMREQQLQEERRRQLQRQQQLQQQAAAAAAYQARQAQQTVPKFGVVVPHKVLQVETRLLNPTKYHVDEKRKHQVRKYLAENLQRRSSDSSEADAQITNHPPTNEEPETTLLLPEATRSPPPVPQAAFHQDPILPSVTQTSYNEQPLSRTTFPQPLISQSTLPQSSFQTIYSEPAISQTTLQQKTGTQTTLPQPAIPQTTLPQPSIPLITMAQTRIDRTSPQSVMPESFPQPGIPQTTSTQATLSHVIIPPTDILQTNFTLPQIPLDQATYAQSIIPQIDVSQAPINQPLNSSPLLYSSSQDTSIQSTTSTSRRPSPINSSSSQPQVPGRTVGVRRHSEV